MVVIGLGSNVGDRLQHLSDAVRYLSKFVSNLITSSIYESPALLKCDAPDDWNVPFLNMAVKGKTTLSPQLLLERVKQIEKKIGRIDRGVWAPREIDIDILVYGDMQINENDLIVPHAGLCQRAFALLPLADVAPKWRYPVEGQYYGKTANAISEIIVSNNDPIVKTSHVLKFV